MLSLFFIFNSYSIIYRNLLTSVNKKCSGKRGKQQEGVDIGHPCTIMKFYFATEILYFYKYK